MAGPYGPPRTMPFGRNKGEKLAEMHQKDLESTLEWLGRTPDKFHDLKAEIQKILAGRRGGDNPARVPIPGAIVPSSGPVVAPSAALHAAAMLIIKVGANILDGLEHTGPAATWLRELAGAAPPDDTPF